MGKKVLWGKQVYGMMRYFQRVAAGHYQLEWQGDVVNVLALKQGPYNWVVQVNGAERYYSPSFNDAVNWVANVWGNEPVMTHNMLNREAGKFPIARKHKGGCCDPATETYHCM